jgi:replicative DNA helicase
MSDDKNKRKIIKHISEAVDEEVSYLTKLKKGLIKPILTSFNFINETALGGLHPSDIITIGGGTGTGKTALLNIFARSIHSLNANVAMLCFNYELASRKMVSRLVSRQIKRVCEKSILKN